jgi:mono/diheme cytochrome c family protein
MRYRRTLIAVWGVACLLALLARQSVAAPVPPEHAKFFESRVWPLLVENCQSCHGEKKQKGGLRLDSAAGLLKGGKNGAVVVAGRPEDSKLILAVSYKDKDLQMPPEDEGRLSAQQVEILTQWVAMGAPWGKDAVADANAPLKGKRRVITEADRAFWSFQPPVDHAAPMVDDHGWCANDVDRFIFAKLAAEGLKPAPQADKVTLVRRAYFDLHGLPPTPEEVAAFVNDASPDAWEKLVDRLLASPRYGERMARHWLDVVRYAESDGYRQDAYRSNVWPYRDYVIRSFNEDKPYDRFVTEQLAGDELAPSDPNALIGTAFLRHGIYEYNQRDVKTHWKNIVDEVTDVTADAFLGLSMGCAKCHDHKFDPILQSDYYRFEAFFTPLLPVQDGLLATSEEKAKYDEALAKWKAKTADIRAELDAIERPYIEKTAKAAIIKFPEDIQEMINKPADQRTPCEQQIATLALRQVYDKTESGDAKVTGPEKEKHLELVRKLAAFDDSKPRPLPTSLLVTDVGTAAPPTVIPGDKTGHDVGIGYPVVLDDQPLKVPATQPTEVSTGRRTALAKWLMQPNHPLTTRVMANRIWQYHFGRGLVGTSSDFGKLGDRPTHPELLDYLAVRFTKDNWQMKGLHKLIMTSAAYRQSSSIPMPPEAKAKDPEGKWLWKYPPRRLDAEQIRDSMLLVSGELKPEMYGPSVDPATPRRSIYTKVIRNNRDPLLEAFDAPDTYGSAADRNRTTTATQALLLINGDAPLKRAEMFAARLRAMNLTDAGATVDAAWRLAYGRTASAAERGAAVAFLEKSANATGNGSPLPVPPSSSIDEKPMVKSMPQLGSQAIYVRNGRTDDMLRLASPAGMPVEDFTVEAYVLLDSLYDDASVRVIASQWDGKNDHPGWALGVTSTRSRFEPQNLILQLACDPKKPGGGYEVIHSDFRVELHKTYYVAVSVRMRETAEAGVTFYLKDMTDMDASLKSVSVKHALTGSYANKSALVIGGRDSKPAHGWDGLIDEVRISRKALAKDELLFNEGRPASGMLCGHWVFEDQPGLFKDSAGVQADLVKLAGAKSASATAPKNDAALVDLCHVLFNSNRFLYLE